MKTPPFDPTLYVLVPREPTSEMVAAMEQRIDQGDRLADVWRDAIAAAPAASAAVGEAKESCLCEVYEDHGPVSELNPDCPIHGHDSQPADDASASSARGGRELGLAVASIRVDKEGYVSLWASSPAQLIRLQQMNGQSVYASPPAAPETIAGWKRDSERLDLLERKCRRTVLNVHDWTVSGGSNIREAIDAAQAAGSQQQGQGGPALGKLKE